MKMWLWLLINTYPHFIKCCVQHGPNIKSHLKFWDVLVGPKHMPSSPLSLSSVPFSPTDGGQLLRLRFPFPQLLFFSQGLKAKASISFLLPASLFFSIVPPVPLPPNYSPNKGSIIARDWHGNPWGWEKVIEKSMCTH